MFGLLRRENTAKAAAKKLQRAIAAEARRPVFHTHFAVPDNVDGRFDLFTLHAYLVLERLKKSGAHSTIDRYLVDEIFDGFQQGLREMGVTDAGLSRRIKAIANAFYGRLSAYDEAKSEDAMVDALLRNIYRGAPKRIEALELAQHIKCLRTSLAAQDISSGDVEFVLAPRELEQTK